VLSDLDGKAHGAYGLEGQPSTVLVRPDGHIAYRDAADRPERLAASCRRIFATASGPTA
jgi:3-(3-hydroxy-phenyl)propionate hydroxylase